MFLDVRDILLANLDSFFWKQISDIYAFFHLISMNIEKPWTPWNSNLVSVVKIIQKSTHIANFWSELWISSYFWNILNLYDDFCYFRNPFIENSPPLFSATILPIVFFPTNERSSSIKSENFRSFEKNHFYYQFESPKAELGSDRIVKKLNCSRSFPNWAFYISV